LLNLDLPLSLAARTARAVLAASAPACCCCAFVVAACALSSLETPTRAATAASVLVSSRRLARMSAMASRVDPSPPPSAFVVVPGAAHVSAPAQPVAS